MNPIADWDISRLKEWASHDYASANKYLTYLYERFVKSNMTLVDILPGSLDVIKKIKGDDKTRIEQSSDAFNAIVSQIQELQEKIRSTPKELRNKEDMEQLETLHSQLEKEHQQIRKQAANFEEIAKNTRETLRELEETARLSLKKNRGTLWWRRWWGWVVKLLLIALVIIFSWLLDKAELITDGWFAEVPLLAIIFFASVSVFLIDPIQQIIMRPLEREHFRSGWNTLNNLYQEYSVAEEKVARAYGVKPERLFALLNLIIEHPEWTMDDLKTLDDFFED